MFGRQRNAWYKQQRKTDETDIRNTIILERVREIRASMPRIGTRKLLYMLQPSLEEHDIEIGRDKFFDLLESHGMLVRRRKRRKAITTDSNHPFYRYPNLIKEIRVTMPGQLWVSDITYIRLLHGFAYLSLITDAYSRKIVGYCLHPDLKRTGTINALNMAINNWTDRGRSLIHHSDRGLQYCCSDYTSILEKNNISISMTEKGDPYENAIAERMNGVLKQQFGLDYCFKNYTEALCVVEKAITIYNKQYPHGSCNYLTPQQAHEQEGELRKKWKSNRNEQSLKYGKRVLTST